MTASRFIEPLTTQAERDQAEARIRRTFSLSPQGLGFVSDDGVRELMVLQALVATFDAAQRVQVTRP